MADSKDEILLLTAADAPPASYAAIYCHDMIEAISSHCRVTTFAIGKKNIENSPSHLAPDCVRAVSAQAVAAVQAAGAGGKIKVVVALLASPILVLCAGKIATALQAELVTITTDTMEVMVANNQHLEAFRPHLIDEYNKLIGQSIRCAAITSSGHEHVSSQLHKTCQLLPLTLEGNLQTPVTVANQPGSKNSKSFEIACFTPAPTTRATFAKFFHSINRLAQSPDLPKISLKVIGALDELSQIAAADNLEIHRLGRLSDPYVDANLSRADLIYICAPLVEKLTCAQEYSVRRLQAKALRAGRSILFHGAREYCSEQILAGVFGSICVSDIGDTYIEQVMTDLLAIEERQLENLSVDFQANHGESYSKREDLWLALIGSA